MQTYGQLSGNAIYMTRPESVARFAFFGIVDLLGANADFGEMYNLTMEARW